jgi:hypothetical protein
VAWPVRGICNLRGSPLNCEGHECMASMGRLLVPCFFSASARGECDWSTGLCRCSHRDPSQGRRWGGPIMPAWGCTMTENVDQTCPWDLYVGWERGWPGSPERNAAPPGSPVGSVGRSLNERGPGTTNRDGRATPHSFPLCPRDLGGERRVTAGRRAVRFHLELGVAWPGTIQ